MARLSWADIPDDFRTGPWAASTLSTPVNEFGVPIIKNGKPVVDKAPRHPATGRLLDMNAPETWATFEECAASSYPAIGRLLLHGGGFTVIDLDAVPAGMDKDQADLLRQFQRQIYEGFPSYAELSQSGEGCHIILRADLSGGYRQPGFEVYGHARYMITTGGVLRAMPIARMQTAVDELAAFMSSKRIALGNCPDDGEDTRTADQIIELASNARNGEKFKRLFHEPPAQGGDWSRLDSSLAALIAFYSRNQRLAVEVFSRSALWRGDGATVKKRGYESPEKYQHDYLLDRTFRRAWGLRAADEEEHAAMCRAAGADGAAIVAAILAQVKGEQ